MNDNAISGNTVSDNEPMNNAAGIPASDEVTDAAETDASDVTDNVDADVEVDEEEDRRNHRGHPFLIVAGAILLLGGASLLPWSKMTNGFIKDFNLFGQLTGETGDAGGNEVIDPELAKAMAEADSLARLPRMVDASGTTPVTPDQVKAPLSPRVNGQMVLEDYTVNSQGLAHLKAALSDTAKRPARIAVIGDSYIEGDILTADIREPLQSAFGGCGVGYVPVSSHVAGFRQTVRENSSGWTGHDIRKGSDFKFAGLSGEHFTADAGAKVTLRGVDAKQHLDKWDNTRFLFVSPAAGTVTITTDSGDHKFDVKGSPEVQCLTVPGSTTQAVMTTSVNGLQALGMYLDGAKGIQVDNMSLRGNSGITHRNISKELATQMREHVDYDLIILEYGMNALTSKQKDYEHYRGLMEQTILHLKECYPKADIIMMGIGDRGQKIGGEVQSLPTSPYMTTAQRNAARNTGVIFWDTREAMGGEGAVVEWRNKSLINPDFIHLNHKGGQELATRFVTTLTKYLDKPKVHKTPVSQTHKTTKR